MSNQQNTCHIDTVEQLKSLFHNDPMFKRQMNRIIGFLKTNKKIQTHIKQQHPTKKYDSVDSLTDNMEIDDALRDVFRCINIPKLLNKLIKNKKPDETFFETGFDNSAEKIRKNGFILDVEKAIIDMMRTTETLEEINNGTNINRVGVIKTTLGNEKRPLIVKYKVLKKDGFFNDMVRDMRDGSLSENQIQYVVDQFFDIHNEDINEIIISNILNALSFICPLFPYFHFASFTFLKILNNQLPAIVSIQEDVGKPIWHITDNFSDRNDDQSILMRNEFYCSMIEQLVFGLYIAQKAFKFVHTDLHAGNILYQRVPLDQKLYYSYKHSSGKQSIYRIHTNGFLMHIIDFGRSSVKIGEKLYYDKYMKTKTNGKSLYQSDMIFLCRKLALQNDEKLKYILADPRYQNLTFVRYFNYILNCKGDTSEAFPQLFCDANTTNIKQCEFNKHVYYHSYSDMDNCKSAQPTQIISNQMAHIKIEQAPINQYVIPMNNCCP